MNPKKKSSKRSTKNLRQRDLSSYRNDALEFESFDFDQEKVDKQNGMNGINLHEDILKPENNHDKQEDNQYESGLIVGNEIRIRKKKENGESSIENGIRYNNKNSGSMVLNLGGSKRNSESKENDKFQKKKTSSYINTSEIFDMNEVVDESERGLNQQSGKTKLKKKKSMLMLDSSNLEKDGSYNLDHDFNQICVLMKGLISNIKKRNGYIYDFNLFIENYHEFSSNVEFLKDYNNKFSQKLEKIGSGLVDSITISNVKRRQLYTNLKTYVPAKTDEVIELQRKNTEESEDFDTMETLKEKELTKKKEISLNKVKENLGKRKSFKGFTRKDLENLDAENALKYDNRTFSEYFCELVLLEHPVLALIFYKSIMDPLQIRIAHFIFTISMSFAFNAIFYTDDFISETADQSLDNSEPSAFLSVSDLKKSMISYVASLVIEFLVLRIISIPDYVEEEFNAVLMTEEQDKIEVGYSKFKSIMMPRYLLYGVIVAILSIGLWYYIAIFCGIYLSSSTDWIKGTFISLAIDWLGVSVFVPLTMAFIRFLVRRFEKLMFLNKVLASIEYVRLMFQY